MMNNSILTTGFHGKTHEVDLKWSLWADDHDLWANEFDLGHVYADIHAALTGAWNLLVHTAPRKEIRYGQVEIRDDEVRVTFTFGWDSPHDLASGWGDARDNIPAEDVAQWLHDHGFEDVWDDPVYTVYRQWAVEIEDPDDADQAAELMRTTMERIDEVEDDLLKEEEILSKAFDIWCNNHPLVFKDASA